MRGRRLTSASFADAVLPSNDTYFAFDGTNSDLARQLYLRAKAGASAAPFKALTVPSLLQDRLADLGLEWEDLPGIAQRAVLWDSGFGVTPTNEVVRIWTLSGHAMTDLAVPLVEFQDVGCTAKNCTQPDKTTGWSNLYCNGDQMLSAARCVVEDFTDKSDIHLAMWETGGNPEVVPAPTVRKHAWVDESSGIQYNVVAVHTLDLTDEPAYGECASSSQNDGYGSLVLPCYTTADEPDAIKSSREEVQGSAWVNRWLVEDFSGEVKATMASKGDSSGLKLTYVLPPVCGFLVVCGLVALFVYSKRRRREAAESDPLEDSLIDGEGLHPPGVKDAPIPQDEFAPNQSTASTLNSSALTAAHGTVDRSTWLRSSSSSFDEDYSSGSNNTLKILLHSEFLVGQRIPYESINFHKALSKGASGEVWLGEYEGQQVAVKRLLQAKAHRADKVEEFAKEIELSASLEHPSIVSFIGVAWNSLNNLVMVLEFFPMGDLQSYLEKHADLMTWAKDKIHIAEGIGRALQYLHARSPPLIHRDLKSKNILLTKRLEAKLIDFGVSRACQEHSMTAGVGTPYWTAPEILEGNRYSEQADIYSFGVVLSELDTGKIPYHDALTSDGKKTKPFQILAEVMAATLRPSFSDNCPPRIVRIGDACCHHDPDKRPTAEQVVKMLQETNFK